MNKNDVINSKLENTESVNENKSIKDYVALAITTFGVGYLPIAPGTWGSMVGVLIYIGFAWFEENFRFQGLSEVQNIGLSHVINSIILLLFCLLGIWSSGYTTKLFKHKDPSQAVVDEVMGQLITFLFIPFTFSWHLILAGFLLFRIFDIWKPYPIDSLQNLPKGIGICADDIIAGVYAGICLSIIYTISLW